MHMDDVEKFYYFLFSKSDKKWGHFSRKVMEAANPEDNHKIIELEQFEKIISEVLGLKLTEKQKELLFNTSGRIIHGKKFINISPIYSQKFLLEVRNLYHNLKIQENEEDDAVDAAGYTGNFRRDFDR